MADPFFRDSVVLVTHRAGPADRRHPQPAHGHQRRQGRPARRQAPAPTKWSSSGGPVDIEDLVVIFRAKDPPRDVIEVLEGVYMTSGTTSSSRCSRAIPGAGLRIFAGYAGWGRGQLEAEVSRGGLAARARGRRDALRPEAEGLWPELFRRSSAKRLR